MWLDFNASRNGTDPSIDLSFATYGAGDEFWFATLFEYVGDTNDQVLTFQGGAVTALGFRIGSDRAVSVLASDNGGSTTYHSTTATGVVDGTYLMLARATLGDTFDSFGVTNSVVDFWFDPTDTSSVGALGTATFTTGADSKFGRSSQSITDVFAQPSQQGRIDEIRLGTSLNQVINVPEPSTTLLGALGFLALLRRRR
jgi:hypothetical protein